MTKPKPKPQDDALQRQEDFYKSLLDRKDRDAERERSRRLNDYLAMQLSYLADKLHNDTVAQSHKCLEIGYQSNEMPVSISIQFAAVRRLREMASAQAMTR